jgi:hypothetical protein
MIATVESFVGLTLVSLHFLVDIDVFYFLLFGLISKIAKPVLFLGGIHIGLCQRLCFNNEAVILESCRIPFQVFQYLLR